MASWLNCQSGSYGIDKVKIVEKLGTNGDVYANVSDVATITCIEPIFQRLVQAMVAMTGVALLVMLLAGGFRYLFSGGNPKALEQASGTISKALIGLTIIVSALLIINLVIAFTGADGAIIRTFRITLP